MDVLMPQLGETVAEGTVSTWHKRVGDRIQADEILLDVETDKVSMEIPAPSAGRVKEICVQEGETVNVGTVLAVIETEQDAARAEGAAAPSAQAPARNAPKPAAAPVEPRRNESPEPRPAAVPAAPLTAASSTGGDTLKLSPAVRRLLGEHRLDATAIAGSGRNGRLTRRDVLAHIEHGAGAEEVPAAAPSATVARFSAPERAIEATPQQEGGSIAPFNRVRRLTAEHMVRSKATSPHVLQAVEVDFSAVERARGAARERWRDVHGYSLSYLPFIAKAVCGALREYPHVNASVEGDGLVLHPSVNLAIAVDLGPGGLVAPVIRAAEALSLTALAEAIHDVAERARGNQLRPDDFAGGTYTLSNSGTFGTLITAPIINQPQVAILSIDGVRKRPVVIEQDGGDAIAIRPVGILAQSFDHRAMDGAYSAAFLARVRSLLEETSWNEEL
jgi:pyruvate dehydrogenase E2 component (dihydrolipoyllysine-residue acetyltransferase)